MITSLQECRQVYHAVIQEAAQQVAEGRLDPYVEHMYSRAVGYLDQTPAEVEAASNVLFGMSKMGFEPPERTGVVRERYLEAGKWLYAYEEGLFFDGDPLPPGYSLGCG